MQAGRLTEGMALLDEAMALVCGPADDRDTAGKSVCSFFTACYYAADFGRAGSWTGLLRKHGLIGTAPGAPAFLSNHCDSVQATALVELGRWSEAEALLPAAHLHLARREYDLARATARRGLRAMADDRPRAAALLTVLVDAELASGDVEAAQQACSDMTKRLATLDIPSLEGQVAAAQSRVQAASGDVDGAIAVLEGAVDRLDTRQLPWRRATLLLEPKTLAVMHGASYHGDGKQALYGLAAAYESLLADA